MGLDEVQSEALCVTFRLPAGRYTCVYLIFSPIK